MAYISIILLVLCAVLHGSWQIDPALDTSEYIILAIDRNISRLQMPSEIHTMLPINDITFVHSVEYDVKHDCVFWADYTRIVRQCLGNDIAEVLVSDGVDRIEDLAYDWLSETLYFVDSNQISAIDTSQRAAAAASDRSYWPRTAVVVGDATITGIAVHPERSYLFWTQYTDSVANGSSDLSGIYRANLDGSDGKKLQGSQHVVHPVKISVDYVTDRLYWIDRRKRGDHYIGGCGLHGENFRTLFSMEMGNTLSQFLLSAYNNVVYWLDCSMNIRASDIRYLDGRGETSQSVVIAANEKFVRDFKVYYRGAQLGTNACSNGKHSCTHVCVGAPNRGFTCLCPDGLQRNANGQCECGTGKEEECFQQLIHRNCQLNPFRCDQNVCMPLKYHCGE